MQQEIPAASNGSDQPTPASEWRQGREQGYLQYLPESGFYAHLRPVTPDILIRTGSVPDTLTPLVVKMLYRGVDDIGTTELFKDDATPEEAADSLELVNLVCKLAFVRPRVVDEPREGEEEIHIDDVPPADRGHIFELCIRGAIMLRSFRYEPETDVEPVPDDEPEPQPA